MKQEDRELLLKDLSARLPYRVKVQYEGNIFDIDYISPMYEEVRLDFADYYTIDISEIKPYLFPLNFMTAEQLYELREMFGFEIEFGNGFIDFNGRLSYLEMDALFEWLDKNHFDYRELIPNGLAINASNLNIY